MVFAALYDVWHSCAWLPRCMSVGVSSPGFPLDRDHCFGVAVRACLYREVGMHTAGTTLLWLLDQTRVSTGTSGTF